MYTLNCNGKLMVVDKPVVMGIINTTPDSFFIGSRIQETDAILFKAEQMIAMGAGILDLGGQSTRPGSVAVNEEEELRRVIPGIEAIHERFPDIFLSVDTWFSRVAREAVTAGASLVNDVSAGTMDPALIDTVASLRVPYVLMHMKGKPSTMQQEATYDDVTGEVLDFFIREIPRIREAGVQDIIVDPGFGFAKTIDHNFTLLKNLAAFQMLQCPVLAGLSRKSTIYKTLNISPEEALNGTTVLNTIALMNGASILRVHDVKEAVEAVTLLARLR